jgi:hypothetical protein
MQPVAPELRIAVLPVEAMDCDRPIAFRQYRSDVKSIVGSLVDQRGECFLGRGRCGRMAHLADNLAARLAQIDVVHADFLFRSRQGAPSDIDPGADSYRIAQADIGRLKSTLRSGLRSTAGPAPIELI